MRHNFNMRTDKCSATAQTVYSQCPFA